MSNSNLLLRQIQDDAVSSTVPVSELLRRCQVLAARLGITELDEWVRHELNGYPADAELPDYRICPGIARGHFSGPFGSGIRHAVLPARNLPKEFRQWAREVRLRQPIATIEDLAPRGDDIMFPWPGDLIARVQRDFYEGMVLGQAWLSIGRSSLVGAIDAVRNRILSFALDAEGFLVENEGPDTDEDSNEVRANLSRVFNTNIFGNVGNLAQGNETAVQHSGIAPGDLSTLLAELQALDVPSEELEHLKTAIADDGDAKLGTNVSQWMTKMFSKAVAGTWSIGVSTATTVLPKLLTKYYGLE